MGKIVKIKESQIKELVKKIIEEQMAKPKPKPEIINLTNKIRRIVPGGGSQADIKMVNNKKLLVINTEMGKHESMYVKTDLLPGGIYFYLEKDGRMFGIGENNKKFEIFPLKR